MVEVQSQIRKWEAFRELSASKAYKDLKSIIDRLRGPASLSEEALSISEKAKSLAKDLSQNSAKSRGCDSTTFAKELIREVEESNKRA